MTVSEASAPAIHPRLERVFGGFDRERLAWALLRGESELGAPAGDIDILVAPGHAERLRDVASASGFARLPAPGHASHVFLIAYDEPTGTWFKLDVVTELAFGPSFAYRLPSVPAGSCLDRRRRVGAAYGLDPRDAFWARLLHALLDKPRIEDGEIAELAGLAAAGREGGPLARSIGRLLPAGWSTDRVVDAVERSDRTELDAVRAGLVRSWSRRSPVATTTRRIGTTVGRRVARIARVRHPRGLEIVLVGAPELTQRVAAGLRDSVPLPVRVLGRAPAKASVARRLRRSIDAGSGLVVRCQVESPPVDESSRGVDLVIVLDGSGDQDPREDPRVRTIDASGPQGAIDRAVAGHIWTALAARWSATSPAGSPS